MTETRLNFAWESLLESFRAKELLVTNLLPDHQGMKGGALESLLQGMMRPLLPSKFAIERNVKLCTNTDVASPEIDLLIWDTQKFARILPDPIFYPEQLGASIEVKKTLTGEEFHSALKNASRTKSLFPISQDAESPRCAFLFAFDTTVGNLHTLESYVEKQMDKYSEIPARLFDMVYILNKALIGLWWPRNAQTAPEFNGGAALPMTKFGESPLVFKFIKPITFKKDEKIRTFSDKIEDATLGDRVKSFLRFMALVNRLLELPQISPNEKILEQSYPQTTNWVSCTSSQFDERTQHIDPNVIAYHFIEEI